MVQGAKSIRTFIGARNYEESREFYQLLGFDEVIIDPKMSYFSVDPKLGFYLQDYYVKGWVDNSMIFLEVEDIEAHHARIEAKNLPDQFPKVRLSSIKNLDWGREFFLHDPSGVLWHVGCFN